MGKLSILETTELFNTVVDKVYDYFEQAYGVMPVDLQDVLAAALRKIQEEDERLCGEQLNCETKMSAPLSS